MNHKFKKNIIGLIFSTLLTIFPLIILHLLYINKFYKIIFIYFCLLLQTFIHFFYFLNLKLKIKNNWNLISLIFVIIIMTIIVIGTNYIMLSLHHRM
ncbi:Cytochrome bo(3) ubiquinol oxidase subunit 4 [Candidatus Annandia adelgestsuga]|uniref:Cytochrome bo(3) ubiquinol oxidase subunit 4 n=1 Tax=Candidatus Annandia adelgestsuga TaxID=1302411 RepID=A0A3S9J7N4_9ENTR|nr:cytochrome o ubiquinol oxidase subunit IV [Candidatus Annandia adelgestsuga]AZP36381.1 Cytochrome bo(3) ubiquinol oxidase subunit 4 [Candidatus Annandia adelgestsuga]